MKAEDVLSYADLVMRISYEPETGEFTHLVTEGRAVAGCRAGCLRKDGYWQITVMKNKMKAHRVAWCLITGAWPIGGLDHINGNESDNRWVNLRLAKHYENCANRGIKSDNKSGVKGVFQRPESGKWRAVISSKAAGKRINLGSFATLEEAAAAYAQAAQTIHGEFARLS